MKVVDEELKWLNDIIETQALELQHEKSRMAGSLFHQYQRFHIFHFLNTCH